jgi:hypothetical protein
MTAIENAVNSLDTLGAAVKGANEGGPGDNQFTRFELTAHIQPHERLWLSEAR